MTNLVRMKPRLRLVETPVERVFGSKEFIARTRRPDLVPPQRFEPAKRVLLRGSGRRFAACRTPQPSDSTPR